MFLNNRKLRMTVFISILIAGCAFAFLPDRIPVHFSKNAVDGYANKAVIFLFPLLEILLAWVSARKSFQYWCMHGKTAPKTEFQYQLIIFCVAAFITVIEAAIIILSIIFF